MRSQPSGPAAPWTPLYGPRHIVPDPVAVRAQVISPRHFFPAHTHAWHQLVHAESGVLTVGLAGGWSLVPSGHALWVPAGQVHQVGASNGAQFLSLYVANRPGLETGYTAYEMSPLLKALIVEASSSDARRDREHIGRVLQLILYLLPRLRKVSFLLPWPKGGALVRVCEALHADPADPRTAALWAHQLGMSSRTFARHFSADLGMDF